MDVHITLTEIIEYSILGVIILGFLIYGVVSIVKSLLGKKKRNV